MPNETATGPLLVADFQTVFTALAMTQAAKYEAERSEDALMQELATMSNANYLSPGAIGSDIEHSITRGSLDAHIKKVQAQQLETMGAAQIDQLVAQSRATYTKRKALVRFLNPKDTPADAVYFDAYAGYHTSQLKTKQLSGRIEEVALDKNMLILLPPRHVRLLNNSLKQYLVYIIDPQTLQPMVDITLL